VSKLRRLSWSLIDQVISSAGNFIASLVAVRSLGVTEFGAFTLAFYVYTFSQGLSYAIAGEPFQVRHASDSSSTEARRAQCGVLGLAGLVGAAVFAACSVLSLAIGGDIGPALLTIGILLPGMLVQDAARHIFFAEGRAQKAAINDGIWLGTLVLALLVIHWTQAHPSATLLLLSWGLTAWIAGIAALLSLKELPRPSRGWHWLLENKNIAGSFATDFVAMNGATQLVSFLLPVIVSLSAVGVLRGAQLIFGPLSVLLVGSRVFGIPEAARLRAEGQKAFKTHILHLAIAATSLAVVYGAVALLIPSSIGVRILGPTWVASRPLVPAVALAMIGGAMALAPFQGLRVMSIGSRILKARAVDAPVTSGLGIGGAFVGGVQGAATGLGCANLLVAGTWWFQYHKAMGDVDWKE